MEQPVCATCGAPDNGQDVICKFCRNAYSAEIQASAIPCPACRTLNRWGRQQCCQCSAWIVVACVFCGALSPHTCAACLQCHEAFAGAQERKMQRAYQQDSQETAQVLGQIGSIVGGIALGGLMIESHRHRR